MTYIQAMEVVGEKWERAGVVMVTRGGESTGARIVDLLWKVASALSVDGLVMLNEFSFREHI